MIHIVKNSGIKNSWYERGTRSTQLTKQLLGFGTDGKALRVHSKAEEAYWMYTGSRMNGRRRGRGQAASVLSYSRVAIRWSNPFYK